MARKAKSIFLLDSNILIAFLGGASQRLHDHMVQEAPRLATSSICCAEVLLGFERLNRDSIPARKLFERMAILQFDMGSASVYAQFPFKRGRFDRLIGAQAVAAQAVLVTANIADFADIPDLRTENWL